ncbi:hypothetical protein [Cryptosporangium sp. NPDC048952]|uniref:hypothetical protein n=1 Tax=Cryptosporangium sp. NPDC048952 TaxID=3363961 RepID=UPI00371E62D7
MEQDLAADTVRFWHGIAQLEVVDRIFLVTTAKESADAGQLATRDLVGAELAQLGQIPDRFEVLHCEQPAQYRAAQLNMAVEHARERLTPASADSVWVGVYNADSRPDPRTFTELRQRTTAEPDTRLFQQLVDYIVPSRGPTGLVAIGNAQLQTWWTRSHYAARNARGHSGRTVWSRTSPYSTFGHGEFARLDFLDHIGGFPDFAYADGLLLGWICRLAAEPIGLLASRDVAEVPRSAADLVLQQTAWLRGLLNFDATAEWCRQQGILRLPDGEVRLLHAQHLAIPVGWGLSTLAVATALTSAACRMRRGRTAAYHLAVVTALAAYPMIPALVPFREHPYGIAAGRRVLGACASWSIEGLAFWPALRSHLARDQQAPAKTPR